MMARRSGSAAGAIPVSYTPADFVPSRVLPPSKAVALSLIKARSTSYQHRRQQRKQQQQHTVLSFSASAVAPHTYVEQGYRGFGVPTPQM